MLKNKSFRKLAFSLVALALLALFCRIHPIYMPLADYQILLPYLILVSVSARIFFKDWKSAALLTLGIGCSSIYISSFLIAAEQKVLTEVLREALAAFRWPLLIGVIIFEAILIYRIVKRISIAIKNDNTIPAALNDGFRDEALGFEVPPMLRQALVSDICGMWTLLIYLKIAKDHDRRLMETIFNLDAGVPAFVYSIAICSICLVAAISVLFLGGVITALMTVVMLYLWTMAFSHGERIARYGIATCGDEVSISLGLLGFLMIPANAFRIEKENHTLNYDMKVGLGNPNAYVVLNDDVEILGKKVSVIGVELKNPAM